MGKQNVGWPSNEIVSIMNFYTQADLENAQNKNEGHTLYDSIYIKMSRLGKSTVEHH